MNNKEQKLLGGGGYLKINNNNLSSYQDNLSYTYVKDSIISNITNSSFNNNPIVNNNINNNTNTNNSIITNSIISTINNKAFSLIELSIVLIIMGLLVAGIMGGSSLIQAAKIRATINEYYEYKTAYNSYYARYGKVPGEDSGRPGLIYGYTGFKDLSDKGFIESSKVTTTDNYRYKILSKFGHDVTWQLTSFADHNRGDNFYKANVFALGFGYRFTAKEAQNLDSKIDDGKADTGICVARGSQKYLQFGKDDGTRNTELSIKLDF